MDDGFVEGLVKGKEMVKERKEDEVKKLNPSTNPRSTHSLKDLAVIWIHVLMIVDL